jgi:hypothetical protein
MLKLYDCYHRNQRVQYICGIESSPQTCLHRHDIAFDKAGAEKKPKGKKFKKVGFFTGFKI